MMLLAKAEGEQQNGVGKVYKVEITHQGCTPYELESLSLVIFEEIMT